MSTEARAHHALPVQLMSSPKRLLIKPKSGLNIEAQTSAVT